MRPARELEGRSFVIAGAMVIDGDGRAFEDRAVMVRDGRIAELNTQPPPGYAGPVIDGRGLTVMPGLIDSHVHVLAYAGPRPAPPPHWQVVTFPEEQLLHAAANARRALESGVTTLRDMAGARAEVALKRALADEVLVGPRLVVCGFVGMTAGHGDLFFPPALEQRPWKTADGPEECRRLVREYARMGTDWIKICTSGGVLSSGDESGWRNFTDAELAAIVDEAHALGKPVAAHAHSRDGIARAVEAGVDSIEHGTELDEALAEAMARRGVYLCCTLTISEFLEQEGPSLGLPAENLRKAHQQYERQIRAARLAREAGVPIIAGTDSCNTMPFGRHAWELAYLVERVGLSPMEAIVAGTSRAARALRVDGATGSIAPGKDADLLVVDGSPLDDIEVLKRPERLLGVFLRGRLAVDRGLSERLRPVDT